LNCKDNTVFLVRLKAIRQLTNGFLEISCIKLYSINKYNNKKDLTVDKNVLFPILKE